MQYNSSPIWQFISSSLYCYSGAVLKEGQIVLVVGNSHSLSLEVNSFGNGLDSRETVVNSGNRSIPMCARLIDVVPEE